MAKVFKLTRPDASKNKRQQALSLRIGGYSHFGILFGRFFTKLSIILSYAPAVVLPQFNQLCQHKNLHMDILFVIVKIGKQPRYTSTGESTGWHIIHQ
jgi:hypothetical protein